VASWLRKKANAADEGEEESDFEHMSGQWIGHAGPARIAGESLKGGW
jgi:hypothetical protein